MIPWSPARMNLARPLSAQVLQDVCSGKSELRSFTDPPSLDMAPHATLFDINLPAQGIIRPRRIDLSAFSSDTEPGSVCAYLGIPFAQPPVGALRWRVPQGPAPSWQGIRESRWAQVPPQSRALMAGVFSLRKGENEEHDPIGQSEDCLYTNVWVPQRRDGEGRNEKWPVMVRVRLYVVSIFDMPSLILPYHPAILLRSGYTAVLCESLLTVTYFFSFADIVSHVTITSLSVSGSCSSPAFDGARLAHESRAIVVSVTYRIGVMGFLGSRILASESAGPHPLVPVHAPSSVDRVSGTGNYGLWDAVAGLLWIRSNIEHFGGDANAVTAFGESAGSILLHYLLLSPAVPSGLFARAILQSGSVETVLPRSLASAQATFDELARFVAPGVTDSQARLEALRAASPAELIEISSRLPMRRPRTEYTPNESENRPTDRRSIPAESLQLEPIGVWGPVWDGVFVPRDLRSLVRAGLPPASTLRNAREGILLGYNVDEGTMFNVPIASSAALKQHVSAFHPSLSPQIARLYATDSATDDPSAFAVCAAYSGDILFESPIRALMSTLARVGDEDLSPREKKSPPAWGYVFAHRPTLRLLRGISASQIGRAHV